MDAIFFKPALFQDGPPEATPEADFAQPRAFCWLSGRSQPAGGRSGLLSKATWTSWWSRVAAGHTGPASSIDVCVVVPAVLQKTKNCNKKPGHVNS